MQRQRFSRHLENSIGRNKRRFFDLAWVSIANGLVIFTAIYCAWSLFVVALVYSGEWLGFFISHAVAFVSLARCGAYKTLIADHRVMVPLLRYGPLLIAAIGISTAREYGTDVAPWFFVLVLAMLAVVNVTSHFVEVDALRVTPGVPQDAQPAE